MDHLSTAQRSWNMSRIRDKDTRPELAVRRMLHRLGFRFRLHTRTLPGSPDIVMPRHRTVVLVHGCYWHRHPSCRFAYMPKSRVDFWNQKFAQNVRRDKRVARALRCDGWRVVTIWECQTPDPSKLQTLLQRRLAFAQQVNRRRTIE